MTAATYAPLQHTARPSPPPAGRHRARTARPSDFTAAVRERAAGQWPAILTALGFPPEALSGRHGPCPGCGGRDRFRFDDRAGRGTFICSQGGGEILSGDGFALLQHVHGWRFPEAVGEVARVLGLRHGDAIQADAKHLAELREKARQRQAKAEAERLAKERRCARHAAALWARGEAVTAHHYLKRKRVGVHGIRQADGLLLVPMRDGAGTLWNVQTIPAVGKKKPWRSGRRKGLFHLIGSAGDPGSVLALAEGYATAATVHEVTGWPVAVGFCSGNLRLAAEALAESYPAARFVICADHDPAGLKGGRAAAAAVNGWLMAPPTPGHDWNDAPQDILAAGAFLAEREMAR